MTDPATRLHAALEGQYHVAPDGRFLMIRSGAGQSDELDDYDHLIVVENWLDELQRLVPRN